MSTVLYYFTGTGNTLAIAEMLKKELPAAEIRPIIQNGSITKIDSGVTSAGIIFPVYMWSVPLVVERFIRENDFSRISYLFAVTNYGGSPGYALPYLNHLLEAKNSGIRASFGFKMPGNYTPMYGAWPAEKQQKTFDMAKEKIKSAALIIADKKETPLYKTLGIFGWFITMVMFKKIMKNKLPALDKSFFADNNCTGCGKCAKVCPVNNIEMQNNRPVWLHKCEQCFACLQTCPVFALQAGKMTKGRKRYHFPGYDFKGHNFSNKN